MSNYALIGHNISHSLSPQLFLERFGAAGHSYRLLDMAQLCDLRQLVADNNLAGFNVTSPFKTAVISQLDFLDDTAREVGAVNCVRVEADGTLSGFNTDAEAFRMTIESFPLSGRQALILGTGGAARAVAYALRQQGVQPLLVSRNPQEGQLSYPQAATLAPKASLIVNATPSGCTLPFSIPNTQSIIFYDLNYSPAQTPFLQSVAHNGTKTIDGMQMLRNQAHLSWHLWHLTTL